MNELLRNRYLQHDDGRAWDLATGDLVALTDEAEPLPPSPETLIEVLDHGRDGEPRSIAAEVRSSAHLSLFVHRAAADGAARGFVPIAADIYWRLRPLLGDALRERTVLLIASGVRSSGDAQRALVDVAARSPRAHVLLMMRVAAGARPSFVREAKAAYAGRRERRLREATPLSPDVGEQLRRAARATAFVAEGRHAAAERVLRDVASALDRRGAASQAAMTRITLGRLLLERGRAAAAEAIFAQAAEGGGDTHLNDTAATARLWQAAARTDLGRLTAAEAICRALLAVDTAPHIRCRATAALARVLLWQRRSDEAVELPWPTVADDDEEAGACADAMRVRLLVRCGRLFEAGGLARALDAQSASSSVALVRVIGAVAQLRVAVESGDCTLAEERLEAVRNAARVARAPLRAARARLLWIEMLQRCGRAPSASRELARLVRVAAAAPPLLRDAIVQCGRGDARWRRASIALPQEHSASAAASLIRLSQAEDDDAKAVMRLLEWVASRVQASRIDLVSSDGGPVTVLQRVGSGLQTRLGPRVLESGIAIGPEPNDPGREIGVPVRTGGRLVAALVARWAADRLAAGSATELLALVAAIASPRIDAMLTAAREEARTATTIPELVGVSAAIDQVRKAVARAAASPFSVLIDGESGVGKELVARAVHALSPRRERRFCDVNCAALPDELLEAELFGHARGAFTGAVVERAGLFEEANGGTLFLDELADLSLRAQAKLLRVIQQQEVRRVGETFSRPVDVRLVAAVNRDIHREVSDGRFRQDLLYRLDVVRVRIPPLRERPEDIGVLAAHFWQVAAARVGTHATLTHGVLAALSRYWWPGNVRELQNVIAALSVAAPARGRVRPALLPTAIGGCAATTSARLADARVQFERRFIETALARAAGSRTRAARDLGVSRQGLLKLMARLGIAGGSDAPATG